MHADRSNRTALILLALLLTAGGVMVVLVNLRVFGDRAATATVFDNPVSRFFGANGAWLWPAIAVLALVVLVVAVRWLIAVLTSTDRAGDHQIPGDRSRGTTTLAANALTTAVITEIESYRGVHSAAARLVGDPTSPDLVVDATLNRDADLVAVRHRIETDAVSHARQSMDQPTMPVTVNLTVTTRQLDRAR